MRLNYLITILAIVLFAACEDEQPMGPTDNFDRRAMLTHWADNFIIPGYTDLATTTTTLREKAAEFTADPSFQTYGALGLAWETAYFRWQEIGWYEIGKAEELSLTNNLNIYPVDEAGLEALILDGNYNFNLPSNIDKQGFPALGYMILGLGDDYDSIEATYTDPTNGQVYRDYLNALTVRIDELAQSVLTDWTTDGYREAFINNNGNSANASVDKLVNDYIFYYEKHLRAGKVGIPAGVFSGDPLPEAIEIAYVPENSRTFLLGSLNAMQLFFNGTGRAAGPSLKAYLDELGIEKNGQSLSTVINDQFDQARTAIDLMDNNLATQIATDNSLMLAAYDELQKNVVHLKVDMLQALNINVDYVDADGD